MVGMGVAGLVVGDPRLVLDGQHLGLLLEAADDAVHGRVEVDKLDLLLVVARGDERGLVAQVLEIGAGEARGSLGDDFEIDAVALV